MLFNVIGTSVATAYYRGRGATGSYVIRCLRNVARFAAACRRHWRADGDSRAAPILNVVNLYSNKLNSYYNTLDCKPTVTVPSWPEANPASLRRARTPTPDAC